MAIFEKLPYTNYHDLNADWIVKKVKEVADAWTEYRDDMDEWKTGVDTELQTFYDWFDNLDLTDEVRTIIEEMVQDGSFITTATPVITSATEDWLAAHVSQGYAVDNTLTISGAAADAKVTGDRITQLKEDLYDISGLKIDGYHKGYVDSDATIVSDAYMGTNGAPASTPAWAYCYLDVKEGETYKVSGTAGTGGRLYVLKNANGEVIDYYQSEVNVVHMDLEYTIPTNGSILFVNTAVGRFATPIIKKPVFTFIKNDVANPVTVEKTGDSKYTITSGLFTHTVDLYGSTNETFTFKTLNMLGATFKPVNDDITPISLGTVGYVGANHGYVWVYKCAITAHGLSNADIGKTSTDGTNTWVLLQVADANTVIVGCYDASVWFKLKRVAPTTLNFGSDDMTVTNSELSQLYPSVKNVEVSIDDGNSTVAVITERYDIIDVGSGIEAIKSNVGSNTNTSIATRADSLIRISNIYEFQDNGAVVQYASSRILKTGIPINFISFIQSAGFSSSDTFWIPEMTSYNGYIPESGSQIDFLKTGWVRSDKPPQEYIQANGGASNVTKAMILGYLINGLRAEEIVTSAGFVSPAGKMYPHFVQLDTELDNVYDFNTIAYRIPCAINTFSIQTGFSLICNYCRVGTDIYLFINTHLSNGDVDFELPEFMQKKKVETIMSRNMTCQSAVTTTSISLAYTIRGSIILRLYD